MQFRDLKSQYRALKPQMDEAIQAVLDSSDYIAGDQVEELEKELAEYVGVKNCVSCGNGTDALVLALKAWGIGAGDAVFVQIIHFSLPQSLWHLWEQLRCSQMCMRIPSTSMWRAWSVAFRQ